MTCGDINQFEETREERGKQKRRFSTAAVPQAADVLLSYSCLLLLFLHTNSTLHTQENMYTCGNVRPHTLVSVASRKMKFLFETLFLSG